MHGHDGKEIAACGAAMRSILGALLASAPAAARERRRPAADGARQDRLFLRRRQDRLVGAGLADDRADVRRILHPEDADAPLPDRDDPRRQPDRHQLHRHAGRPRRLGAIFRAARPRRLCGRSGGARPLGAFLAIAGQGRGRATSSAPSSASPRRRDPICGRRRSCTPNGRARGQAGDPAFDQFYASQFPSLVELSEAAGAQTATPASRCSTRSDRRC